MTTLITAAEETRTRPEYNNDYGFLDGGGGGGVISSLSSFRVIEEN